MATSTSPIQQNSVASSKSCTQFLCKSLLVIFFLIALPLFPSQAPDSINLNILTKFWELLHLLFVGIAVSYGLFGKRNVEVGVETHSNIDNSLSNMSQMFHVNSIFEDEFEGPCGYDENNMIRTWNSQYFKDESVVIDDDGSSVRAEQSETRSTIYENGYKISSGFDEKVIQSWNSNYFQGESMVGVATNGSYAGNEWEVPELSITNTPLGLPVRSLRSRILEPDNDQFVNGSGSSSRLKGSSKSSNKFRTKKFSDLGPLDLEGKFKETDALPSPIPWHSRSGSTEIKEELGSVTHISHSMPLPAEEYQYELLRSRSFRTTRSFSSQTSSMSSSSPNKLSPSPSISSELSNSKMEELGTKKSLCGSSSTVFPSPSTLRNSKTPSDRPNSRRFSVGSSSEINVRSSFKDEIKDFSKSGREDPSVRKEWGGLGSLKTDMKPASLVKASLRGKSVRTIRASEHTAEANKVREISGNRIDDKVGKTFDEVEAAALMERTGMITGGLKNPLVDNKEVNLDSQCHMPNPAFLNCQKGEKQEVGENSIAESEEGDSECKDDNFQVSSDEEEEEEEEERTSNTVNYVVSDVEVDKKAGEFIAKFKEQIRLQKINSLKGSSGLWATRW